METSAIKASNIFPCFHNTKERWIMRAQKPQKTKCSKTNLSKFVFPLTSFPIHFLRRSSAKFAWYRLAKVSILVSLEIFLQLSSFAGARRCFKLPARRSTVSIAISFSWLAWIEKANLAADWVIWNSDFYARFLFIKVQSKQNISLLKGVSRETSEREHNCQ